MTATRLGSKGFPLLSPDSCERRDKNGVTDAATQEPACPAPLASPPRPCHLVATVVIHPARTADDDQKRWNDACGQGCLEIHCGKGHAPPVR